MVEGWIRFKLEGDCLGECRVLFCLLFLLVVCMMCYLWILGSRERWLIFKCVELSFKRYRKVRILGILIGNLVRIYVSILYMSF